MNKELEGFDAEYADELTGDILRLIMERSHRSGVAIYEELFAVASVAGVVLESTGDDIDKARPWFETTVTKKIVEAQNVRASRRRN
jgi:hypothetical protein